MMRKMTAFVLMLLLVLSLGISASANENTGYVFDYAQLLNSSEAEQMNEFAQDVAEEYDCGLYIMTLDDYTDYDDDLDVYDAAWNIYHELELGVGKERNGVFLLLSIEDRDYALFVYGEDAEYAFNDHGLTLLEEEFLDDFGDNDWYAGFADYLTTGADYLQRAAEGDPVRGSPAILIVIFILVSCVISLIITGVFWLQMKNVRMKSDARVYASAAGLNLTIRQDSFSHQMVSRRRIERSSGSGSGSRSHSGGGGHGRSGKF